jgi:Holliday junction resolvasome RuvABC ATP-dependent DNA helicase subunit
MEAISQKGSHAVLYGERGVGKTSLSNVLADFLSDLQQAPLILRGNCDASDTYSSLWKKALADISIPHIKQEIGFNGAEKIEQQSIISTLPEELSPNDIRIILSRFRANTNVIIIFDEFDRLSDKLVATTLMADTIKLLSDSGVNATILLIGVADSVDKLIEHHHSIERALIQIPMQRMSSEEIKEIILKGLNRLTMNISPEALEEIIDLSQGLPYITHLLSLGSVNATLDDKEKTISTSHIKTGIQNALEQWQQSIKSTYYAAVKSQQPDNIYKEVLLACGLAKVDELGYFTAAAVRLPLNQIISGKNYGIPNFARHLKEFSEERRGCVLERTGEKRRIRYRFRGPIMRPYLTIKGFSDGLLTKEKIKKIEQEFSQPS